MARPHSPDSLRSPSPAAAHQPMTKRDVRRNRIMERLQSMISSFSSHQQAHYRAQLQAIQVDMTLVSRADPYAGLPLDDDGDDLEERVKELIGGEDGLKSIAGSGEGADEATRDFWALAGKRYEEFVHSVNNAIEERDSELTALHNNYTASLAELDLLTQQKLHQAQEEHVHLSGTIRQRLIASLTKKRNQLLKDKENLDIGDANALLMHPRHFSLNAGSLEAPGSPGGPGARHDRKTRHLRHRAGSPGAAENGVGGDTGKRKRKAGALDDDGNDSPAPAFRLPPPDNLGGGRSPFRDAREKQIHAQYEAPAYSLERIFTDKELAMATDTARTATWRRFYQPEIPRRKEQEDDTTRAGGNLGDGAANGSTDALKEGDNGQSTTEATEGLEEANAAPTIENGNGSPLPSQSTPALPVAAPEMERTSSHQVLTRGGARANPLAALSDLASVAAIHGQRREAEHHQMVLPFAPIAPNHHAVARTEKNGAPAPAAVSNYMADNDWAEMMRGDDENGEERTGLDVDRRDHQGDIGMENGIDTGAPGYSLTLEGGVPPESPRTVRRRLLDQALNNTYGLVGGASASSPFRLPLTESGAAVVDRKGVDRLPGTGFAPLSVYHEQRARMQASLATGAVTATGTVATPPVGNLAQALRARGGGTGGEPMSRNTSTGGLSEIGDGPTSGVGRVRRTRGI